jgi:hypothetical protein
MFERHPLKLTSADIVEPDQDARASTFRASRLRLPAPHEQRARQDHLVLMQWSWRSALLIVRAVSHRFCPTRYNPGERPESINQIDRLDRCEARFDVGCGSAPEAGPPQRLRQLPVFSSKVWVMKVWIIRGSDRRRSGPPCHVKLRRRYNSLTKIYGVPFPAPIHTFGGQSRYRSR